MTLVSNDPSWWPLINTSFIFSYFAVSSCVVLIYDWMLTFGQEVELTWRQRWSLITVLYLAVRYGGMLHVTTRILTAVPTVSMTDAGCYIVYHVQQCVEEIVDVILGVILIARLHAMYQRSRKVLIVIVATFLAVRITNAVIVIMSMMHTSSEEFVLSGTYQCSYDYEGDTMFLAIMTWILALAWEVLALCLAVWIAGKHFRELQQHSTRGITGDCFTVLMKTHVSYFTSFVCISCLTIGLLSPTFSNFESLKSQIYFGFVTISQFVQMFVLGPRLILGIREYHAQLVDGSDSATVMTSIAFQERVHVETSNSV